MLEIFPVTCLTVFLNQPHFYPITKKNYENEEYFFSFLQSRYFCCCYIKAFCEAFIASLDAYQVVLCPYIAIVKTILTVDKKSLKEDSGKGGLTMVDEINP